MQTQLLIGGSWRDGSSGATIAVTDPATGAHIAAVASATPGDATAACQAAHEAQIEWAATSPRARAEVLRRVWELMIEHQDELADLIVREQGKPMSDAMGEVSYAAEFFRWNSEEVARIRGTIATAPSGNNKIIVHHPPVGVVVIVTPWNFPAAMITRKLAPCLAAGNAAVIKPPAETPLTALRIARLLADAGVPDGVVNVLPTDDAAAWFDAAVDHPATRMVSFTGSTATGRALLKRSADRVLKTVMELGGNAPFIVFDDADIDAAVDGAMVAKMRHSAETCTAANRFFVHADVAAEFTAKLAAAMGAVTVGDGHELAERRAEDGVVDRELRHAFAHLDPVRQVIGRNVLGGARDEVVLLDIAPEQDVVARIAVRPPRRRECRAAVLGRVGAQDWVEEAGVDDEEVALGGEDRTCRGRGEDVLVVSCRRNPALDTGRCVPELHRRRVGDRRNRSVGRAPPDESDLATNVNLQPLGRVGERPHPDRAVLPPHGDRRAGRIDRDVRQGSAGRECREDLFGVDVDDGDSVGPGGDRGHPTVEADRQQW